MRLIEFCCSIRQLIRWSLAVGLLAAFLAPGPAQAQGPPESQGLWQTFTTANSGLRDNDVTALLEERAALHGMDVPTSLCNEMDCEREAIAWIEAELEQVRGKT